MSAETQRSPCDRIAATRRAAAHAGSTTSSADVGRRMQACFSSPTFSIRLCAFSSGRRRSGLHFAGRSLLRDKRRDRHSGGERRQDSDWRSIRRSQACPGPGSARRDDSCRSLRSTPARGKVRYGKPRGWQQASSLVADTWTSAGDCDCPMSVQVGWSAPAVEFLGGATTDNLDKTVYYWTRIKKRGDAARIIEKFFPQKCGDSI